MGGDGSEGPETAPVGRLADRPEMRIMYIMLNAVCDWQDAKPAPPRPQVSGPCSFLRKDGFLVALLRAFHSVRLLTAPHTFGYLPVGVELGEGILEVSRVQSSLKKWTLPASERGSSCCGRPGGRPRNACGSPFPVCSWSASPARPVQWSGWKSRVRLPGTRDYLLVRS